MHNTLTRRNFLKLNLVAGTTLLATWHVPRLAHTTVENSIYERGLPDVPSLLGTPTDIVLRWPHSGTCWSIDADSCVLQFDRDKCFWKVDEVMISQRTSLLMRAMRTLQPEQVLYFPSGSRLFVARWATQTPQYQALMVLPYQTDDQKVLHKFSW